MSEWVDNEPGPQCACGWPTFVFLDRGNPSLLCFGHTPEAGASFPLPKTKPDKWPAMTHEEMVALVNEGMKEQGLAPGDDATGPADPPAE